MAQPIILVEYDPSWVQKYEMEQERILDALGDCTEGGVLYDIAHVGSTSVPGLAAKPCLDIAARVHPLPLPDERVAALELLGYEHLGEYGIPGRHFFRKGPHEVHLHVVSFDTEHWPRYVLFRDYLRAHPQAARRYERLKRELASKHHHDREAYTNGKGPLIQELERAAFAWHVHETKFKPVEAIALELDGFERPWFVSSGWALDLFLGKPARHHDDLDIVIWRDDGLALQAHLVARGWLLHKVVAGGRNVRWEAGEEFEASVHQVHARREGDFLDLLLSPRQEGRWVYRRLEDITLPLEQATMRSRGIPHLSPEVVLLFKSATSGKAPRGKDQEDFERVLPALPHARRIWLREALVRSSPEHPWLVALSRSFQAPKRQARPEDDQEQRQREEGEAGVEAGHRPDQRGHVGKGVNDHGDEEIAGVEVDEGEDEAQDEQPQQVGGQGRKHQLSDQEDVGNMNESEEGLRKDER
jgi:GrpB-like predicted nucleotidyltransferase (UPF0157 family)